MLNKWIAPLIVIAVLVLASCNDMDGDGEDDTGNGTTSTMGSDDPETNTNTPPAPAPVPPRTQDVAPEPPSSTGLVGSWRFIADSFDPDVGDGEYKEGADNEPTHDTLTFGSTGPPFSFMRVEKQYVYDAAAVVPHPYPDPGDDPIPTVTGAWLELSDPFTLEDATYEVTQKEDDQSVSQVIITRVTSEEGVPVVEASVTCDFEIVTTHHTPPIRYLTLADCQGEVDTSVSPPLIITDPEPFIRILAVGVLNKDRSRPVKLSTTGLSYNPRSYSYRFVDTSE